MILIVVISSYLFLSIIPEPVATTDQLLNHASDIYQRGYMDSWSAKWELQNQNYLRDSMTKEDIITRDSCIFIEEYYDKYTNYK